MSANRNFPASCGGCRRQAQHSVFRLSPVSLKASVFQIGQYVPMAPPPVTEVVRLGDDCGGVLAIERALVPGGYPLLVHSGSPGSRRLRPRQVERAAEAGFCLLSYDRPGYGDSSPRNGRAVANAADDVAMIADAFGYSELAVWGFSGGGPFALATAARLPRWSVLAA